MKKKRLCAWFLFLLLLFPGCTSVSIQENPFGDGTLPDIHPKAGIEQEATVTLYFRHPTEDLLVQEERAILVRTNEDPAQAVLRSLINGPGSNSMLKSVLPAKTRIVSGSRDADVFTVTFNRAVLGDANWDDTEKRLSVYAVVNSLCDLDESIHSVQILVAQDNSDTGEYVTRADFALVGGSATLEAVRVEESVIASPATFARQALSYLVDEEYLQARPYFTSGNEENRVPDYLEFGAHMSRVARIESFEKMQTQTQTQTQAQVTANIKWRSPSQIQSEIKENAILQMIYEDNLYKIDYEAFIELFEAKP